MESQSETTQTVSALKLPVLKTGDYDLWSMRMEQYLTHTDFIFGWFCEVMACYLHQLVLTPIDVLWESRMKRSLWELSRPGLDKNYDRDESQMAAGHVYHEGEKILKEDRKELISMAKKLAQGIRGTRNEMLRDEGTSRYIYLQMPGCPSGIGGMIGALRQKKASQTLL
ncbi:hypothetical protein Tco_0320727 [Tanacetum coccineum]